MAGILLIQTAFIGDVILATPLVEELHKQFPQQPIDFLLRKGNEGLLKGHPKIRKLLIWEKKGGKYKDLGRLLGKIRRESYETIINLHRFSSSGFLTLFSGAGTTIGFDKNPFSRFFSHRLPHVMEEGTHEVDRNLSLLEPLLPQIPARRRPKLYPSKTDWDKVMPYLSKPYVCMAPNSVWYTKAYPPHRWIALINQIPTSCQVYLLGGPADQGSCQEIQDASSHPAVSNLAGKLSLLQSAVLMESAEMNYVNDSAPMHLASSMNAPTAAIFCSTDPIFGFGPLAEKATVVQHPTPPPCKPCGLHGLASCPQKHFKCAEEIPLESFPFPTL